MRCTRAFTLVEILIVVVILGILAAIVVPSFSSATRQASAVATLDQLVKVREALSLYYFQNRSQYPSQIAAGDATWGELTHSNGDYLGAPPRNFWVDPTARTILDFQTTPDAGYQSSVAWHYAHDGTGNLWAGAFDATDKPYPHP